MHRVRQRESQKTSFPRRSLVLWKDVILRMTPLSVACDIILVRLASPFACLHERNVMLYGVTSDPSLNLNVVLSPQAEDL